MSPIAGCPFCASNIVQTQRNMNGARAWDVGCVTCGARGPVAKSEADAIAMWNTGVPRTTEVR